MIKDKDLILALEKELAIANLRIENLHSIYENAMEAIIVVADNNISRVNKKVLDLFGYNREELIGQDIFDVLSLKDCDPTVEYSFFEADSTVEAYLEAKTKNGKKIVLESRMQEFQSDIKSRFVYTFNDISQQLKKEYKFHNLNDGFSAIFNNSDFGLAIIDVKKQCYLDVNEKSCDILGYSKEEFLQLVPSQVTMEAKHSTNRILARKSSRYIRTLRTKSGELKHISINMYYSNYSGNELYYSVFNDITKELDQRKIIEDKQHFLDSILHKSDVTSWDFNYNTGELTCSSNLFSILDRDQDALPQNTEDMAKIIYPDDRLALSQQIKDYFTEVIPDFSIDIRMLKKDGKIHWMRVTSIELIRDEYGHPYRVLGLYIDVNSDKEKKRKLRVSEEQFKRLFMHINAGFSLHQMIRNIDGEIVDSKCILANDMFADIIRFKEDNILGNYLSKAFPNFLEQWLAIFKKLEECGTPITMVEHYQETDQYLELSLYIPQKNQVALLVTDITLRVKQEEELKANHRYLEEKNKEFKIKNKELEVITSEVLEGRASFNNAFRHEDNFNSTSVHGDGRLYGRWEYDFLKDKFIGTDGVHDIFAYKKSGKDLTMEGLLSLINKDERERVKQEFSESIKAGVVCKQEYSIIAAGVEKTLLSQGIPQVNEEGKVYKYVGILLDITDRRRIEERLRRQNDHYLRVNEELIVAKEKAEESEKLKTAFFANMSHEIRTPMNGILGFSGLLMEPEVDDDERLEYSQIIVDSGKRLLSIVNDILDISKIESDTVKVTKTEVDLNKLLTDLYRLFSQDKKNKKEGVNLVLNKGLSDEDSVFITDENRLSQILSNLLSNALKFTDFGEVTVGYYLHQDELSFYVKDSGVGIPLDMQERIFEPFRQVDNKLVRQYGGTGLGLSISRKLCRLMGGDMTLESTQGKGSVFVFTLPYERKAKVQKIIPQNDASIKLSDTESQKMCVLIAEDEDVNFLFLKSFLGRKLQLLRAESGAEAIDMVEKHPEIDLILMDLKMPIMDGLEATRRIKRKHPELPIIAQTAYAMTEDKEASYQAGCDNYITKPINRRKLLELIHSYLPKR